MTEGDTAIFEPEHLRDAMAVRAETDRLLATFHERKLAEAYAVDKSYGQLWEATRKVMLAGGKRLRPYLTVLAYKAFGGTDDRSIMQVALAQELLHGCLLVHDDIIDRDFVRHGVPNIAGQYHGIYKPSGLPAGEIDHYGMSAALLAGDLLLAGAFEVVAESGLGPAEKLVVQRSLQRSVFMVAGGELLDAESNFSRQDDDTPQKIARLKTSSYSFESPLECGAALAGAPQEQVAALRSAGEIAGVAYQMYDDLLGMFGDERKIGKPVASDLAEGKRTVLLQRTLSACDEADRAYILRTIGKGSIGQADVERIRQLMVDTDAKHSVGSYAAEQLAETRKRLEAVEMDQPYKGYALKFLESLRPVKM